MMCTTYTQTNPQKLSSSFFSLPRKNLISIRDLEKKHILHILNLARNFKKTPPKPLLKDKLMGIYFAEPSTRTRLSFEAAMKRLGGNSLGISDIKTSSIQKGESLQDTLQILGEYVDLLVVRHPLEGSARAASLATNIPVINGGDGGNEHPTQTLLDLFSILECQGSLESISIAFVGDLKYSRTVHSLALASCFFNIRIYFISPSCLQMPSHICHELKRSGCRFSFHPTLEEIIKKIDILYMTRIQKERFLNPLEYETSHMDFSIDSNILSQAKKSLKILHPLPRLKEIPKYLDHSPHAYYFEQAKNGLYIRQALLCLLLLTPEEMAAHGY